jgi:SAM-dependent methyltransferase
MKPLDRLIQRLRILKAGKFIALNSRLLDIGCADGAIFKILGRKISRGIGIDPGIEHGHIRANYQLIRGTFPQDLPADEPGFDAITLLAVLEHIPLDQQPVMAANIHRHLKQGGKLIITVPSPMVDKILNGLKYLGWIDGMSLDEHYGFDVKTVRDTFSLSGLDFVRHEYFQLGLNNLFVFRKS